MSANKRTLGILAAAIVVVHLPMYCDHLLGHGEWHFPCSIATYGLMLFVPFALARVAPQAADFDKQLFPKVWVHWVWFLGMILLLFVSQRLAVRVIMRLGFYSFPFEPSSRTVTPAILLLCTSVQILLGCIAEEIFWRGYLLEQFRKLVHSSIALLMHSILFALAHLHSGLGVSAWAFLFGTIVGMWRIRFRSLLPLILAHIILNGVVYGPFLKFQYDQATSPNCRQIDLLTKEPVEKAVPAIVGFLADPDEHVRIYAASLLIERYRPSAEPYLKAALASKDKNVLNNALFVVEMCHYSGLQQEVREIAWSSDDRLVQIMAVNTLRWLEDAEGLRKIAETHVNERVRESAKARLADLEAKK
jgi:membrane protease YdiL (CAAX protease family)